MNSKSPSPQPSPGVRLDVARHRPGEGAGSEAERETRRAQELSDDFVLALTGAGAAAVAVVRINGTLTAGFLAAHFSKPARSGRCVHGELRDGENVIDDVVVVLSEDGQGADINLHGSPWTVARASELAKRFGFRVADDVGESSLEGADGETVLEREAMAWLPLARSELSLRILGGQIGAWEALRLTSPTADRLKGMAADSGLWRMLHPPRVAITGRPNVGKSTLANQLFGQERSITADLAGTTRDWVGEYANVDGLPIMLVDTPGIRETTDRIEAEAISASRAEIAGADLVLLVVDARELEEAACTEHLAVIRVMNKCDLLKSDETGALEGVRVSAKTGAGIDALRRAIADHFGCGEIDAKQARWWTERQRELLARGILP